MDAVVAVTYAVIAGFGIGIGLGLLAGGFVIAFALRGFRQRADALLRAACQR